MSSVVLNQDGTFTVTDQVESSKTFTIADMDVEIAAAEEKIASFHDAIAIQQAHKDDCLAIKAQMVALIATPES